MPTPTDQKTYDRIKAKIKKDAKSRWPSAYLSGKLVQEYKLAMKKKGKPAYKSSSGSKKKSSLKRWYDEKWVDIKTGKPCGSVKSSKYYPTCRPSKVVSKKHTPRAVSELTPAQKKKMIQLKQKAKKRVVRYDKLV